MEAPRLLGKRKPLGDCTNTVSRSSSSTVKFANPSLTSSLKRLITQTTIKDKPNHVLDNNNSTLSIATKSRPETRRISADSRVLDPSPSRKRKDVNNPKVDDVSGSLSVERHVTRRMGTDSGFAVTEPTRAQKLRLDQGVVGEKEVVAPYSVYTVRRKVTGVKRSKDVASSSAVANLRLDLMPSSGKRTRQASENKQKASKKVAPVKRQRAEKHEEDNVIHGASQDYVEQQRAYFAEVDAFELQEEEVSSSDLD